MFTLREPSDEDVAEFISQQAKEPFSYAEVGATQSAAPAGYTIDHNRTQLGQGEKVYRRAVEALKQWRQFELGWVTIGSRGVKVEKGATVAVKARACGLWSLNACRVVYVIGEQESVHRFGFAYGTLTDHIERGEERFLIEWRRDDDSVWYDILAFSQPQHLLVKAGFPVARRLQKRFARDSMAVMKALCRNL
jgi:uncharacterized protein (UPF0548 family)